MSTRAGATIWRVHCTSPRHHCVTQLATASRRFEDRMAPHLRPAGCCDRTACGAHRPSSTLTPLRDSRLADPRELVVRDVGAAIVTRQKQPAVAEGDGAAAAQCPINSRCLARRPATDRGPAYIHTHTHAHTRSDAGWPPMMRHRSMSVRAQGPHGASARSRSSRGTSARALAHALDERALAQSPHQCRHRPHSRVAVQAGEQAAGHDGADGALQEDGARALHGPVAAAGRAVRAKEEGRRVLERDAQEAAPGGPTWRQRGDNESSVTERATGIPVSAE